MNFGFLWTKQTVCNRKVTVKRVSIVTVCIYNFFLEDRLSGPETFRWDAS